MITDSITSSKGGGSPKIIGIGVYFLTIVALASNTLLKDDTAPLAGSWLLLTGLFVTVPAILLLPKPALETQTPGPQQSAAA